MTTSDGTAVPEALPFLAGDSEMARRIRTFDWSGHPFGPPSGWPQSLRSALSICLHSAFPTAIYWGPELRLLYNDAWAPIPGPRHPGALGRPAAEVWSDIWHVIEPQFAALLASGEGFFVRDQMLPMRRYGVPEETYWNYSFTAIRDEAGEIGGIFNSGNETTDTVLAKRKMEFLLRLGEALREAGDPLVARRRATAMLGEHLAADRVGFAEVDPDGETVHVVEDWAPEDGSSLDRRHALSDFGPTVSDRFARGQVLRFGDIRRTPGDDDPAYRDALRRLGIVSNLSIPWMDGDRLSGALFIHAASPRDWTEHDVDAAQQTLEWTWGAIERARAGERERLMTREIDHRAKNALAVVQAVARLTGGKTVEAYRDKLEARLGALARSHNLLAAGRWGSVDFETLVRAELEPFGLGEAGAIALGGPALALQPEAAQTVGLVLHELTTNAVKHGALATPEGRLDVRWRLGEDGMLAFEWRESGREHAGRAVGAAARGFGSVLLERAVERQLGGSIEVDWTGGLPHYRIRLPLNGGRPEDAGEGAGRTAPTPAPQGPPRILLAEDEPLVALELEERLIAFGYEVFATSATLSEGLQALERGLPDGAVLDANLCGESSVALAEALHARGVPVIFATGYDVIDNLPDSLARSPLLAKPVGDAALREALRRTVGAPDAAD